MNDLDTIDKKLRDKARRECEARLEAGVRQFSKLFTNGTTNAWVEVELPTPTKMSPGVTSMSVFSLIYLIEKKLKACECPAHEQAAVDDFLAKVERLGEEVEDLQNEINQ